MRLTKTDFIQYLNCPKSLWMLKHEPDLFPRVEFSAFLQKITREGYEVEGYVRDFFNQHGGRVVNYQSTFETEDGLFARADALERTQDGQVILYEVKSSTRVKTDVAHNHLKDACFQKLCAERAGQVIDRVFLAHLNGTYVRLGEVDPTQLLSFVDVTDAVTGMMEETAGEIDAALALIRQVELNQEGCTCLHKSRSNHCDTFSMFNPKIPLPSIYSLPRLSAKQRVHLVDMRIFDLLEVPEDFPLTLVQARVVLAAKGRTPQINLEGIRDFLEGINFPLYFLDYETYASAIPLFDRTSPHKHFPVQYSLHILEADGALGHEEYLEQDARLPDQLITRLQSQIDSEGSILAWHASFEKSQNLEMARLFPGDSEFLEGLNDRIVDLEEPFKMDYVDVSFDGSSSIKKVLPVVCPKLNYNDLEVQDGSSAMEAWERMIAAEPDEAERIANALLEYCERDTFAMVEIYRFLVRLIT